MSLKMLIESDPHQTRIAVLEDDRLTEIFVERHRHRGLVGNVYTLTSSFLPSQASPGARGVSAAAMRVR